MTAAINIRRALAVLIMAIVLSLSLPAMAHEGEDHSQEEAQTISAQQESDDSSQNKIIAAVALLTAAGAVGLRYYVNDKR